MNLGAEAEVTFPIQEVEVTLPVPEGGEGVAMATSPPEAAGTSHLEVEEARPGGEGVQSMMPHEEAGAVEEEGGEGPPRRSPRITTV